MLFFENPLVIALVSLFGGLFIKYSWDRWFSRDSRVNRDEFITALDNLSKECALRRENCLNVRSSNKAYFESLIRKQEGCLTEAFQEEEIIERRRSQTRRALLCIMMSQLKICEALNTVLSVKMDCTDISKLMVEMGVIE